MVIKTNTIININKIININTIINKINNYIIGSKTPGSVLKCIPCLSVLAYVDVHLCVLCVNKTGSILINKPGRKKTKLIFLCSKYKKLKSDIMKSVSDLMKHETLH